MFDIRAVTRDPRFSLRLGSVYADVFRFRIAQLGRQQTDYKRRFLRDRMANATARLKTAQAALDQYREQNHLAAPETQLGSAVGQLAGLQAAMQGKRVELESALRFGTPDSQAVKAIAAQFESLRSQVQEYQRSDASQGGLTVTGIARRSNEYINLQREVAFTQLLYQGYEQLLEGLTLEEMTADFNLLPIEPPYVEPGIYIRGGMAAVLILIVLTAITCEVYVAGPRVVRRTRPMLRAAE